jgi:hypothetical protein
VVLEAGSLSIPPPESKFTNTRNEMTLHEILLYGRCLNGKPCFVSWDELAAVAGELGIRAWRKLPTGNTVKVKKTVLLQKILECCEPMRGNRTTGPSDAKKEHRIEVQP